MEVSFATKHLDQFQQYRNELRELVTQLASMADIHQLMVQDNSDVLNAESNVPLAEQPLGDVLRAKAKALDTPFRLAVVGEFSRGKSTLINTLLQRDVLANDHRPNTAAQTVLKYGTDEFFRVYYVPKAKREPETIRTNEIMQTLSQFVSDASVNDYEALLNGDRISLAENIDHVEVWCDSPFLQRLQIEIIDTPGLGSVFQAHKDVTLKAVRSVDATLFTVQIDPGIGRGEIAFVRFISEHVSRLFFVVTKVDKVDEREITDRVEHIRKTIQIKADVQVSHIYPVSARLAAEGNLANSGFSNFLPALEMFLVQSSGIVRLLNPVRFTRIHARQIADIATSEIRRLNNSVEQLEQELQSLRTESDRIKKEAQKLLEYIDDRIKNIIENTLTNIDDLPHLIRMKVEQEIDSLDQDELRRADFFIQPAIKEAIVGWIDNRKVALNTDIKALNANVKKRMLEIMKTLQFDEEQLTLIRSIEFEVNMPLDVSQYTKDIGDAVIKLLLSSGISNSIANIVGSFARTASNVFSTIRRGLGRLFGGRQQSAPVDNTSQTKRQLKDAMLASLEGNNFNAYHGVVFGYRNGTHQVNGVRDAITEAFSEWGNSLKSDTTKVVTNNLNYRTRELERQLKEKRAGIENQAAEKNRLNKEVAQTQTLIKKLGELERQIMQLSDVKQ